MGERRVSTEDEGERITLGGCFGVECLSYDRGAGRADLTVNLTT